MDNNKYQDLLVRLKKLEEAVFVKSNTSDSLGPDAGSKLNWSLNERAFVSKYAKGKSGTEKFVLLVAFLTKGDSNQEVALRDIEKLWNKMTAKSLLGMKFNRKYPNEAKTRGWVNPIRSGIYELALGWEEIIENESATAQ